MNESLDIYFLKNWRSGVEIRRLNVDGRYNFSAEGAFYISVRIFANRIEPGLLVAFVDWKTQDNIRLLNSDDFEQYKWCVSTQPYIPFQGDMSVEIKGFGTKGVEDVFVEVRFIRIQSRQERVKVAGL